MRIVVTRPENRAGELVGRLRERGHEVAVCPLIGVEPIGDDPIALDGYDWVVVTSRTGAELLARRAVGAWPSVAAIGRGTAAVLRELGHEPELVPSVSTQEGLVRELPRPAGRVLFAGAEAARGYLAERLEADFVPLYRTIELAPAELPAGDLVVLASASAARAFARTGSDLPAISIGPETTRAARAAGVRVAAEAETHDLEGLLNAIERACSSLS